MQAYRIQKQKNGRFQPEQPEQLLSSSARLFLYTLYRVYSLHPLHSPTLLALPALVLWLP